MQESKLQAAVSLLNQGNLVAIPTETVYGIAANALNEKAVLRIFQAKKRPAFDPLIIHIATAQELSRWTTETFPQAFQLAEHFWPGPLTLVLPKRSVIPDLVTSGLDTVAVRVPAHPLTLDLLKRLDFPLAAPSANPFGYISPTTAQHVADQLGHEVSLILDGGASKIGLESTILGFEKGEPIIYRVGGTSVEAIESVIGKVKWKPHSTSNPKAPGMLSSHYAPSKPFHILGEKEKVKGFSCGNHVPEECGFLGFNRYHPLIPKENQILLSPRGDLVEAAHKLFASMRHLDAQPTKAILTELVPEQGLGRAINDRLRRAATR